MKTYRVGEKGSSVCTVETNLARAVGLRSVRELVWHER